MYRQRTFRARMLAAVQKMLIALVLSLAGPAFGYAAPVAEPAAGEPASFWVTVRGRADLSPAADRSTKAAKGAFVRATLIAEAERTQAGLRRFLRERGADFTPYWIANVVRVTGDRALAAELARRPDVLRVEPDTAPAPAPPRAPATARAAAGPEEHVRRVRADRVWDELGVRGEGVVVATIDTGVQFDHPALIGSYRGRFRNGRVAHDYSWFDASGGCPAGVPCDDGGHGTHVTGIAVGRTADGAQQIGVAPSARWIAARADSQEDHLEAGQWMLAPTDLDGRNPRPDLAPDVVNNSWRYTTPAGFFGDVLAAWVAAGIFPVVAAGNDGDACGSVAWPASLLDAYTVGNLDAGDRVYRRSSRGPTIDGHTKPDIAAPGTDIRSSSWSGDYETMTGTSQAAPAVAGAVALLWSAAPELDGDVAATRRVLDGTARPVPDLGCGGTEAFNNAAGHGLLDAYGAVRAAPRSGLGGLRTAVREAGTGRPLPDATVLLTGPRDKVLTGDERLDRMVPGTYRYRVTAHGHAEATGTVTVTGGKVRALPVTLPRKPSGTVTGVVRGPGGTALAGATVAVAGTPEYVRTGADGRYRLTVPTGPAGIEVSVPDR